MTWDPGKNPLKEMLLRSLTTYLLTHTTSKLSFNSSHDRTYQQSHQQPPAAQYY